jgi:uncharacterized protein YjiK
LLIIASIIIFSSIAVSLEKTDVTDILFRHEWVGNIDKVGFKEPSGIVFHPQRGTLFAVGDGGDVCEIKTDGTLVKQKLICEADFEGIACDPSTGLLYIAIEGEERIVEVNPDSFEMLREFDIPRTFQGKTVLKEGGQGIEGITFVPEDNHPEGGTFYITNQSFDPEDMEELSAVFQIKLPLKSGSGEKLKAEIIRYFSPGVTDLSGIHYDSISRRLCVISDANNVFLEITITGEIADFYTFPGRDQEGIAMDPEGFLYIAQDTGGILKIRWNR